MQHVRQISGNFLFTHAAPEGVLLLGSDNRAFLSDIRMMIWCEHSFPTNFLQTSEISDLRIYLDASDISSKVSTAIAAALKQRASAKDEYAAAMDRWIEMLAREAPSIGLKSELIAQQRVLAKSYSAMDWSKHFGSLRTQGYGYRGGLHPLNYLFKEILISPVSLRTALFPDSKKEDLPLNKLTDSRLIISHGPCRFYSGSPSPVKFQYEGGITASAQAVYEDSWELEMRHRLGDIALEVAGLSDKVLDLKTRYSDFEKRAAEFKLIADGIEASLKDLSRL